MQTLGHLATNVRDSVTIDSVRQAILHLTASHHSDSLALVSAQAGTSLLSWVQTGGAVVAAIAAIGAFIIAIRQASDSRRLADQGAEALRDARQERQDALRREEEDRSEERERRERELQRLRDEISCALAAEMGRAWHVMREVREVWHPPRVDLPTAFGIEVGVYTTLADKMSMLAPDLLVVVVATYGEFAWLNRARFEYDRLDERREGPLGQWAANEMDRLIGTFEQRLRATQALCKSV